MHHGHVVLITAAVSFAVSILVVGLAGHDLLPDFITGGIRIENAAGQRLNPIT